MNSNDIIDLHVKELKNAIENIDMLERKNNKSSILEDMLTMIDKEHSIVVSDELGLMGGFYSEDSMQKTDAYNIKKYDKYELSQLKRFSTFGSNINKRGDYFKVIDKDGTIALDENVTQTYIIFGKNGIDGYAFILDKCVSTQQFDLFFDDTMYRPTIVIMMNNNLYINNTTNESLKHKYKYDKNIEIETTTTKRDGEWLRKLMFNGKAYNCGLIDSNNKIGVCREIRLSL